MRLRQIEVFHAVYSSGSITGAAALLNVSQPSVSKVLAHAEQQLGYLARGKAVRPNQSVWFSLVKTMIENGFQVFQKRRA